jgi:fatty acid desaturase
MKSLPKQQIRELHEPRWSGMWTWMAFGKGFCVLEGLLLVLLWQGPEGWLEVSAVVLVLLVAHVMHGHLIAFHEAAHGSLCPVGWLNDFFGLHVSFFNLLSLELFRVVHHSHHAHLATERDEELWPFVQTGAPRWARRLAAFLELTCGLFFTPCIFLWALLRPGTTIQNPKQRRRILLEQGAIWVAWLAVVAAVAWWDLWKFWLVMYLVPALLAGNLQSARKYIEHMGLFGGTVLSVTRSVVPPGPVGRLVALSLFNEPYHGAHHLYGRIPQAALRQASGLLVTPEPGNVPPYRSYARAFVDMARTLEDPRIGPQWCQRAS